MNANSAITAEKQPPNWDLTDLYADLSAPEIDTDLTWAAESAAAFRKMHSEKVSDLPGDVLAEAIGAYESILERAYKVMSFAQLLQAADTTNADIAQFHQKCRERVFLP